MNLAPIVIFAFNRPRHLEKTLESLKHNKLANSSNIIIYIDGPRSTNDAEKIDEIRQYLKTVSGFKSVVAEYRSKNLGLSTSIIQGLNQAFMSSDKLIVLEDDMVTSPYFLMYMNEALNKYEGDSDVACVHGYVYPGVKEQPETFFLRGADCWGWGTWRESWKLFNSDGQFLLKELRKKNLIKQFDFNDSYPFSTMLQNQVLGKNDSWAIRWYASIFLENKLTLYPSRSLVQNIGMDSSGQNCIETSGYDVNLSSKPVVIKDILVINSKDRYLEFESFFRSQHKGLFQRIFKKIRMLL